MIATRVIPVLLLSGQGLVKTVGFKDPKYVGDPRNAVKIFNEKMADELVLLDIDATPKDRGPRFELIEEIVSEAFMPVAYGGGIRTIEDAERVVALGVEKTIVSTHAVEDPAFVRRLADRLGRQSIVTCLDVKRSVGGGYQVRTHSGQKRTGTTPVILARQLEGEGAGEILINSIDRDGTMRGFDLDLIRSVSSAINVPLIACGGAGSLEDIGQVVQAGASAAAAGSLFVFHGRHRSVLISYPSPEKLQEIFPR